MKEANQLLGVVRKGYILGSPIIQVTNGEGSVVIQLVDSHPGLRTLLCVPYDCASHGLVPPLTQWQEHLRLTEKGLAELAAKLTLE